MTSATTIEAQIPSVSQKIGKMSTARISKTNVRKKEIVAEVMPSLSAVKNEEPKMAKPEKRNEQEKIGNAWIVRANNPSS